MPDLNDKIIPPQIINDELYDILHQIAMHHEIKTFLEIGCSSGDGSTGAIIEGLKKNPNYPDISFHGIEASPIRFRVLKSIYMHEKRVSFHNVVTVPIEEAISDEEIRQYYKKYSFMDWLPVEQFIKDKYLQYEYFQSFRLQTNGIEIVRAIAGIDNFDAVLIDGGAFTGYAEYKRLYGAKFIVMDDIKVPKCMKAYSELLVDQKYFLLKENLKLRFGYAVFKRST